MTNQLTPEQRELTEDQWRSLADLEAALRDGEHVCNPSKYSSCTRRMFHFVRYDGKMTRVLDPTTAEGAVGWQSIAKLTVGPSEDGNTWVADSYTIPASGVGDGPIEAITAAALAYAERTVKKWE